MRRTVLLLLVAGLLSAGSVSAQDFGTVEPLSLLIAPQYPRPYETVTVAPRSNLIDLAASTITLYVNGRKTGEGSGAAGFAVAMPGPGEQANIEIVASYQNKTYSAQANIRPADVALVVEALSTTHQFYHGAPLVAPEGRVRLVAIPDIRTSPGNRIPASVLSYTWKAGDRVFTTESGIGKSVLLSEAPLRYRDATVSVVVKTQDGSVAAAASVVVAPVDPIVRMYENSPLLGPLFERAVESPFSMKEDEQGFIAVPYFFGATPGFTWSVNGTESGTEDTITVRAGGAGAGEAMLSVLAEGSGLFSSAGFSSLIRFGEESSGGFFGL